MLKLTAADHIRMDSFCLSHCTRTLGETAERRAYCRENLMSPYCPEGLGEFYREPDPATAAEGNSHEMADQPQ